MSDQPKSIVRDLRSGSFRIDDSFVDAFAKIVGPAATLVYLSLCRHANRQQEAWPAIELIGTKMGIKSKHTVISGIRKLEQHGIIGVLRGKNKRGKQAVNVYVLIDKSQWSERAVSHDPARPVRVQKMHPAPSATIAPGPGAKNAPGGAYHRVQPLHRKGSSYVKEGNQSVEKSESDLDSIRTTLTATRLALERQGVLRPKSKTTT